MNLGSYMVNGPVTNNSLPSCNTYPNPYPGQPAPGGFFVPVGVAVGDGYIFVSDPEMEAIQVFDMNGNYITYFWPYTSYGYEDETPLGMKVSNGNLYVANADQGNIDVYQIPSIVSQSNVSQGCNVVYAYASYWNNNSGCGPTDVDVDSFGDMFVADGCSYSYTGAVYVIAPDLNWDTSSTCGYSCDYANEGTDVKYTTEYGAPSIDGGYIDFDGIGSVAVDPGGHHVYVGDAYNNVVQIYDGSLNSKGFIGNPTGAPSTQTGQFDFPIGVALDNQGNLLVADAYNGRVQQMTTSGKVLNIIGATQTLGELYSPTFLTVDSNNRLYVTDTNTATVNIYSGQ